MRSAEGSLNRLGVLEVYVEVIPASGVAVNTFSMTATP